MRANAVPKLPLSPARQALADAMTALEELRSRQHDAADRLAASQQAEADRNIAEATWREFVIEDELADEPNHIERARLKSAVRDARERASTLGEDQAAIGRLNIEGVSLVEAVRVHTEAVVLEQGRIFAERAKHHEILALNYRTATDMLVAKLQMDAERFADTRDPSEMRPGEQRNHGRRNALRQLAMQIMSALRHAPTQEQEPVALNRRREEARVYAEQASAFIDAIQTDPDATIPHPEA